ncbi:MAG: GNAT family N-acetyltransferase [Pseudomonadota bacterium]
MITVAPGDPRELEATALLKASHALMQSLFPPEDNFYLDIDALLSPSVRFFVARKAATTVGTGALALKEGYGEVKSMFVAQAARGLGVAGALLEAIESAAREAGLPALKLETGDVLHAAHRLYRRHGFSDCPRFGDYPEANSSIFMEKLL